MKRSAHPEGRSRREAAAESNVIAEFESSTGVPLALKATYAWGLDLSGTETGAGGVGGLLFTKLHATPGSPVLAPCYDGNGNMLAYLDCATGQTLARYEYDPFGKLLLKEEDTRVAGRLHHQFSTKYTDDETGLSYYGYRYYAPEVGRWVSRDPIGERGGLNLYAIVANDAVNSTDVLGNEGWMLVGDGIGGGECPSPPSPCDVAIAEAIKSWSNPDLGFSDKYRHCVAHCQISKACPDGISEFGGEFVEFTDLIQQALGKGGGPDPEDQIANQAGRDCAGTDCHCCCLQNAPGK